MGKFKVRQETEEALLQRMARLGIKEEDLEEKFVKGSGRGGQKINKTSSTVYLIHKPSGTEVKCQQERSQALNRFFARRELCDKIEEEILGVASRAKQEIEKIRRQKRRRSRRQKEKILADKSAQSVKKNLRRKVLGEE